MIKTGKLFSTVFNIVALRLKVNVLKICKDRFPEAFATTSFSEKDTVILELHPQLSLLSASHFSGHKTRPDYVLYRQLLIEVDKISRAPLTSS